MRSPLALLRAWHSENIDLKRNDHETVKNLTICYFNNEFCHYRGARLNGTSQMSLVTHNARAKYERSSRLVPLVDKIPLPLRI